MHIVVPYSLGDVYAKCKQLYPSSKVLRTVHAKQCQKVTLSIGDMTLHLAQWHAGYCLLVADESSISACEKLFDDDMKQVVDKQQKVEVESGVTGEENISVWKCLNKDAYSLTEQRRLEALSTKLNEFLQSIDLDTAVLLYRAVNEFPQECRSLILHNLKGYLELRDD